jgi:hypothetical protein
MNSPSTSPSGSSVSEAEAFLAAHPDIEAVDIVLHDSNGIGRGKIIRRSELLSVYESGRFMPMSILALDICGEDVHETGLIWDQGDGDLRAWPVPGTLTAMHGTRPPRAEVLLSLYSLDGAPMSSDPRHALQSQVDALAAEKRYPAAAFELEFVLVANDRDVDGRLRPADAVLDGRMSNKTEVYSVDHLHGMEPLFSDVYAGAALAGIEAETVISEYAPGQYVRRRQGLPNLGPNLVYPEQVEGPGVLAPEGEILDPGSSILQDFVLELGNVFLPPVVGAAADPQLHQHLGPGLRAAPGGIERDDAPRHQVLALEILGDPGRRPWLLSPERSGQKARSQKENE